MTFAKTALSGLGFLALVLVLALIFLCVLLFVMFQSNAWSSAIITCGLLASASWLARSAPPRTRFHAFLAVSLGLTCQAFLVPATAYLIEASTNVYYMSDFLSRLTSIEHPGRAVLASLPIALPAVFVGGLLLRWSKLPLPVRQTLYLTLFTAACLLVLSETLSYSLSGIFTLPPHLAFLWFAAFWPLLYQLNRNCIFLKAPLPLSPINETSTARRLQTEGENDESRL